MSAHEIEILERWQDHGAQWRLVHLSDGLAIIDLCTCYGEPVERLESREPELIEYLLGRTREEQP